MKNASQATVLGLILATGATLLTPMTASADGLQTNKNLWRNIAAGAAALTGIGLINHNSSEIAVGAIGTVVGLSQYEQDRHQQSVQQNGWNNEPGYGSAPYTNYGGQRVSFGWRVRSHWRHSEGIGFQYYQASVPNNEQAPQCAPPPAQSPDQDQPPPQYDPNANTDGNQNQSAPPQYQVQDNGPYNN